MENFKDNLFTLLEVSTANITPGDGELIGREGAPLRMAEHDGGYGTLFFVPHPHDDFSMHEYELAEFGFSHAFVLIVKQARDLGARFLYFDADAPRLPDEFPTFEW